MTDEQQKLLNILGDTVDGLESFQAAHESPHIEHLLGNVRYVRDRLHAEWTYGRGGRMMQVRLPTRSGTHRRRALRRHAWRGDRNSPLHSGRAAQARPEEVDMARRWSNDGSRDTLGTSSSSSLSGRRYLRNQTSGSTRRRVLRAAGRGSPQAGSVTR